MKLGERLMLAAKHKQMCAETDPDLSWFDSQGEFIGMYIVKPLHTWLRTALPNQDLHD